MSDGGQDQELDARRKRARFRSWHRGMREMDLILGPFADAEIGGLTEPEIEQYEALLEFPDPDLLDWITAKRKAPADAPAALLARIGRRLPGMKQTVPQ